ncbi:MAG: DUF4861 family protein [Candidatus Hydrogenedentes bacterium]|nr:DUF4861 family protein [Candidatus Hydrogenedentota bacterium]
MRGFGLLAILLCLFAGHAILAQDAATDPAAPAPAAPAPAEPAPALPAPPAEPVPAPAPAEPVPMPGVPAEVTETPAPMPETQVPAEDPVAAPAAAVPEAPVPAPAPQPAGTPLARVFGTAVTLDETMRQQVLAEEPGKRHYIDANQDGIPEEVWFIDLAPRHPEEWRPLLVRAIDEDGDLTMGGQPDQDSDLYIADWHADGIVDAVLDYTDVDKDQDIDEMGLYFAASGPWGPEGSVAVWWGSDTGDDNLLWYDVGYTYNQALCQYHSHFGGNELFSAFALAPDAAEWKPVLENPFVFYDLDGDGVSEETIRYDAEGAAIKTYRHSFDADNDSTPRNPRDYDVSITAHAPNGGVPIDPASLQTVQLRGIPTAPFLAHAPAQTAGVPAVWDRTLLVWDENDHNVNGEDFADTDERWEGIIAQGVDGFPQVGGPSAGQANKRYELATQTGQPIQAYYHATDHRIHLRGAQRAWLDVDSDLDHTVDMKYSIADADGDGVLDTWSVDVNADGTPEDSWTAAGAEVRDIPWNWGAVNAMRTEIAASLSQNLLGLTQRLEQAVAAAGADPHADIVSQLVRSSLTGPAIDPELRRKLMNSDESVAFYLDLLKDRLIVQLKAVAPDAPFWPAFNEARGRGDLAAMQAQLEQTYALAEAVPAYADWIMPKRTEAAGGPRVVCAQDWVPEHIGLENEEVAYRYYWGQIDFYGKNRDGFMLSTLTGDQQDGPWGIDALFVRDTAGCGGVTLYINGEAYPVWSPQGKGFVLFEKSVVEQADDHVIVEAKAANVGPEGGTYTVRMRYSLYAGRRDTGIEVLAEGGKSEDVIELGINLTRLTEQPFYMLDQEAGVMAVRGYQSPKVGTIGMGAVYPAARFLRVGDAPSENQVVLSIEKGVPLVYHVQGDWVRGRRFPVAPSDTDWMNELRTLAVSLALK